MAINFICNSDKYTFNDVSKTISMPISFPEFPKEFMSDGCIFSLKSSFHITLVPIGKIIEKHRINIPDFYDLLLKDFCDFVNLNDIKLLGYHNEFRFVEENDLKTIVVMCNVSGLDDFFKLINQKYNLNLETPPVHVTVYTLPEKLGIFILDSEDINIKTKQIVNLELSKYLK